MVVNILVNVVLDMCLLELDCIVTVPGVSTLPNDCVLVFFFFFFFQFCVD
jgi:hypothetical protein